MRDFRFRPVGGRLRPRPASRTRRRKSEMRNHGPRGREALRSVADRAQAPAVQARLSRLGRLAQLGERLPYKQEVGGSIPSPPMGPRIAHFSLQPTCVRPYGNKVSERPLRGVKWSQVAVPRIGPRTNLHPPRARGGNMYLQRAHLTSGVGRVGSSPESWIGPKSSRHRTSLQATSWSWVCLARLAASRK